MWGRIMHAIMVIAGFTAVNAYRRYMVGFPNAGSIPCVDNAEGCHGTNICEASGHSSCLSLGDATGIANDWGALFKGELVWDVNICSADTDGDGFTNGDELGDPCCAWNYGDAPMFASDISHPSYGSSFPATRPSYSAAPPGAVLDLTVAVAAPGVVTLIWTPAPGVCESHVVLSVGSTSITRGALGNSVHICNETLLGAGTAFSVSVTPSNRAGAAASPAIVAGVISFGAPHPCPGTEYTTQPILLNLAGTRMKELAVAPPPLQGIAIAIAIVGVAIAAGTLLTLCASDPLSATRALVVHAPTLLLCTRCRHLWHAKGHAHTSHPLVPLSHSSWSPVDIMLSSTGYLVGLSAVVAAASVVWGYATTFYAFQVYGLLNGLTIVRGSGYALSFCLGLQLLPVARFSLWTRLLGVSFERGVRLHRWLGVATTLLTLIHGVGMIVGYAGSPLGWQYTFTWQPRESINPLAGALAGIFTLVVALSSLPPIRRAAYEVTLGGHAVWPLVYAFGVLHTAKSDTPALPLFVLGLVLTCIDWALMALDWFWRPVEVLGAGVIATGHGAHSERPAVAYIVLRKHDFPGLWAFRYFPGQFVTLCIPKVSLVPHPFSISSVAAAADPTRFTIHIRSLGEGTWSHKTVQFIAKLQADAAATRGGRSPSASPVEVALEGSPHPFAVPQDVDPKRIGPVLVTGPFGHVSLQLSHYSHFILIGGGIGITPIAALHHAIVHGLPIDHDSGHRRQWPCKCGPRAKRGIIQQEPPSAASFLSLTTAWSVREPGLAAAFAPLLTHTVPPAAAGRSNVPRGEVDVTIYTGGSHKERQAHAAERTHAVALPPPPVGAGTMLSGDAVTQSPVVSAGLQATSDAVQVPVPGVQTGENAIATATADGASGGPPSHADRRPLPSGSEFDRITAEFGLQVVHDRPHLATIFANVSAGVRRLGSRAGSGRPAVAVVVCGPAALVESAYAAALAANAHGTSLEPRFDVHRETFLL